MIDFFPYIILYKGLMHDWYCIATATTNKHDAIIFRFRKTFYIKQPEYSNENKTLVFLID